MNYILTAGEFGYLLPHWPDPLPTSPVELVAEIEARIEIMRAFVIARHGRTRHKPSAGQGTEPVTEPVKVHLPHADRRAYI